MSFPRYPKYKDSGVDWLGEVPEHWTLRRLRQIGPLLKGCGGSKEDVVETGVPCVRYGDLYTTHAYMIRQARTCVTEERAADYFPIRRGDVLFAASGEDLAEIGRSAVVLVDERACCGGDLVVLRPDVGVVPEYMGYACDCSVAKSQKASMGRGTTVKHIYPDELKRLLLAIPPLPEQAAIATFLDRETAKIDALIAEQQRLIELLQEKRQAVISHAVTEGLNPAAPMKDSGIEWLGEVPEHWAVKPVRYACRIDNTLRTPIDKQTRSDIVGEYPYYGPTGVLSWIDQYVADGEYFLLGEDGDHFLKYQTQSMTVNVRGRFNVNNHAHLIRGIGNCSTPWASLFFEHKDLLPWLIKQGVGRYKLRKETLVTIPVLVPPPEEQERILAEAHRVKEATTTLVAEAQRAITLLQERRSALISAAVTGQIDVRNYSSEGAAA